MQVFFYMPRKYLPSEDRQASWTAGHIPALLGGGKAASVQSWLYQTWVELRSAARVELVTDLPDEGIIITLSNLLHEGFRATRRQFVAAVAADFLPHAGAQVQILQNAAHARRLPGSFFVPHWPQPNLLPRDPARGSRVETAAFYGDPSNLARDLIDPAFHKRLFDETGVRLKLRDADEWHDFSDADIVVAIRDFTRARHLSKPATKLYNAWLAGVPLVGGSDSAFSAEGNPGTDFLVAASPEELLQHVCTLKGNPAKWRSIVEAGKARSVTRSRGAITKIWQQLCNSEIPQRFEAWKQKSPLEQAALWQLNRGMYFLDRKFRS